LRGVTVAALLTLSGCSGNAPVAPASAAADALTAYDADKDGALDAKELEACPALQALAAKLKKTKLTADDIAARLAAYAGGPGRVTFACAVLLDGAPLDGATVTFRPETFLGPGFKPARGVSQGGQVDPATEGDSIGLALGMYRVEVSKLDAAGREAIPAKYNARSVLGCEVGPDAGSRGGGPTTFRLTSK
jgi:hypothetical protein